MTNQPMRRLGRHLKHRLRTRGLATEALEPRVVLAADPIISEFLASNQNGLSDNDRESSDWIEIYNRGDEAADLEGWYLTDDEENLTKWTFPSVTVNAGEFLVVFASGKDRQDDDGELHTNFRLSAGGEYLALVQPDGTSVATDFAPEYPEQYTDVSYGISMGERDVTFLGPGSQAQVLVPTDNSLATTWTQPGFVPSSEWITEAADDSPLTVGIGYETDSGFSQDIATDIGNAMKGVNASVYVRVPFQVANPTAVEDLLLRMKYDDGYIVYLNGGIIDLQNANFFSTYNSTADGPRDNAEAIVYNEINLVDYRDQLIAGENVLAIHGMNVSVDDDDFLIVPELVTKEQNIDVESVGYFSTPTPGAFNPQEFSIAPSITDVGHSPTAPTEAEPWVVTARVQETLNTIAQVQLVYRVMYEEEITLAMTDDGTGNDAVANDGIYTGVIPAGVADRGEMLRYYVTAEDSSGQQGRNPAALDQSGTDRSPEYYGTVIPDSTISDNLPVLHWFTESVSRARSRSGARASVYHNGEFYDNVFVRQRGGATNGASQKFNFNEDQPFYVNEIVGHVVEFNMNAQGSDPTFLRQSLAFESYAWAGNQTSSSFLMNLQLNGSSDRIGVFIEQVDENYLERQGLDPDGALYKFVQRSNLDPVFSDVTTGIEKKTRLDEGLDDLRAVVDGLRADTANAQNGGEVRGDSVFDHFNLAQVMNYLAVRSITLDADDVRKNFYGYRDTNGTGQWMIFPWDKDWTFGILGDGGIHLEHPFFGDYDHRKQNANQWNRLYEAVFNDPVLSEMYLRRLRTVMDEVLQAPGTSPSEGRYETRIDEMLAEAGNLLSAGAISQAEGALKNYFPNRRQTLYNEHVATGGEVTVLLPEFPENASYFVPTDSSLGTTWTGLEPPDNAGAWSTGQAGFGFNERFAEFINTEVNPEDSCDACTSLYVRIPFDLTDAASIEELTLRMRYDDGFVAYINGTEVARSSNVTEAPDFDTRVRSRSNTAAAQFENYVISSFTNVLRDGENILAIHGMNSSPGSNDMLLSPVLVEGIVGNESAAGIPLEQVGNPPVTFGQYDYDPSSGNQDEEYIELLNPLETAVDISGWRLTGGIEHTFAAGTVIPSSSAMYVSPSVQDFMARTEGPRGGQRLVVQGNYQGHLSNLGETVTLLAADGTVMDRFTTPVTPSDAQQFLRVSEVHYNPPGPGDATEFIELHNISTGNQAVTLDLSGVKLTRGPAAEFVIPDGTSLPAGAFVVVAKDPVALAAAYPELTAAQILGPFTGSLNNAGEDIRLDDPRGNTIVAFRYDDSNVWPARADGEGASLELIDVSGTPTDILSKPYAWRGSYDMGGSPGRAGSSAPGVVINEVMANTDGPGVEDAVELQNTSDAAVDLTGWYLSDSSNNFKKYAFPPGTTIPAGGYLVVTETEFNSAQAGDNGFGLNGTEGDDLWLVRVDPASGDVTHFSDDVHFQAMPSGESMGRIEGAGDALVPLQVATFGQANSEARVGPVIISKVNYHPDEPSDEAIAIFPAMTRDDLEFIQIYNPGPGILDLTNWRLRGGVEMDFDPQTAVAPGDTLVIVSFNPDRDTNTLRTAAFRQHYGLDDSTALVGGYQGQLSNSDDRLQLQRPGPAPADDPDVIPYFYEDEVRYDDLPPWPQGTDGDGLALIRNIPDGAGVLASSWRAGAPEPDRLEFVNADLNGDGMVDAADIDRLCLGINTSDLTFDLDGNGTLDLADLDYFVTRILNTTLGDSNLDGRFNSTDLVQIFQVGEYEDTIVGNSTWSDGDWNCDGEFNTSDLVAAFQAGGYVNAATPARHRTAASQATLAAAPLAAAIDSLWRDQQAPSSESKDLRLLDESFAGDESTPRQMVEVLRRADDVSSSDAPAPSMDRTQSIDQAVAELDDLIPPFWGISEGE